MSCACFFTTASSFFFVMYFLILSVAYFTLPCASNPGRRILHEPFFPLDSPPPSQPPSPSPPTPTPPDTPFFPTFPSPPPPPSLTALPSLPGNVSSLILPQSSKPHSSTSKLLAVTAAAAISAVIVIGIIVFYYFRRRFRNRKVSDDNKKYRSSDNNNRRYSTNANTGSSPKLRTTSMSSEFLYLGTLVDSTGINNSSNVAEDHEKMESPELRPLPPLNKQGSRQNGGNGRVGITTGDDNLYSPRVSLGGLDSSIGPGSGSRRVFGDVAGADSGSRSIDSISCSSSRSSPSTGSPSRSISISPPPISLSPHLKSPETVAIESPAPPPPPPPPPQRPLWESPDEATPTVQPMGKRPSLIPPSRPFVSQSTAKISPVELMPSSKAMENLEETPKPKLKPLHWDKVRASSDREMVWDQLRSSSFK